MNYTIRLEQINKSFDNNQVLHNINLTVEAGEFVVLVGPSGCGKSTLLRILAGLEQASSGKILCNEEDITYHEPRERNFSMIFQNYALFPHMSVKDNITFGMKMRKEPKDSYDQKAIEVADMLQLTQLLDRKPKHLSGGQRQRVAMARAIIRNPKLFLMDEPLSNLDAKLRVEVRAGVMQLHENLKTSTVYVTHDQVEAMTMADKIIVLNKGVIQQIGSPEQLYSQPSNLFVATFIGTPSMNIFETMIDTNAAILGNHKINIPNADDYIGNSILLGLRPEHLNDINETPLFLQGKVINKELHGAEYLIAVQTDLGLVNYRRINKGNIPQKDDIVRLYFQENDLHFFSTDSHNNLKKGGI